MSIDPVPKEIASAIAIVMRAFGRLVKDGRNNHGGYSYASTDAFFEVANPACAEAGLIIKPRALSVTIEMHEVNDKASKALVQKRMVHAVYSFVLIHESGATWCDPEDRRAVILDYTGPQSLGAAESYAVKTFMRSLFLVATGEKDADQQEQHQAEVIRATVQAVKAKKETGEEQILWKFDGDVEPVPAMMLTDRVLMFLKEFKSAGAASNWWASNMEGREKFNVLHPRLALDLKRKYEAAIEAIAGSEAA